MVFVWVFVVVVVLSLAFHFQPLQVSVQINQPSQNVKKTFGLGSDILEGYFKKTYPKSEGDVF